MLALLTIIGYCVVAIRGSNYLNWPGSDAVINVDKSDYFPPNLSGLAYVSPSSDIDSDVIYGIMNNPSKLFKLRWDGKNWVNFDTDNWSTGKSLLYPNGKGAPDTEDLTFDDNFSLFACSERDGTNDKVNRLSVLKYSVEGNATSLTASAEWDFTADFPDTAINFAFEGITWVPDSLLVANKFVDESTKALYDPTAYPGHGNGAVFVAHEGNGMIYGYLLMPSGKYARISSFASGEASLASLTLDRETQYLWVECDDSSSGHLAVFQLSAATGGFTNVARYTRPNSMPNYNNEGFAIAPESECDSATKQKFVYWTDDSVDEGHALRRDTIPCGRYL